MRKILGRTMVAAMARWCYRRNIVPIGGVSESTLIGLYFAARRPHSFGVP